MAGRDHRRRRRDGTHVLGVGSPLITSPALGLYCGRRRRQRGSGSGGGVRLRRADGTSSRERRDVVSEAPTRGIVALHRTSSIGMERMLNLLSW
ncbi:hypothetical protein B296_00045839 [Ensete ventricosum]|uniref:Uncharacterized protein n=1 Tax=Ensete ventricosum TaxID=4639 RepID=A0A426Z657_ENSVE|nr:hypothetical protein B296_00045839 [Ensete ventricosum]